MTTLKTAERSWKSLSRKSTVSWCRKHVVLDYGPFNPDRIPMIREPLDTMDRVRGCKFLVLGPIQLMKTLIGQLKTLRDFQVAPGRAAIYFDTGDAVKDFSDDKLTPLFDNTRVLQHLLPEDRYKKTKQSVLFPHVPFRLLSAGVAGDRNSKTLEKIVCDEAWCYKSGQLTEIFGRMTSYPLTYQAVIPTSAGDKGSEIDKMYEDSDQRVWHVPCPECGEFFAYDMNFGQIDGTVTKGGLRFDTSDEVRKKDGTLNRLKFKKSVYYECPHCEAQLKHNAARQHRMNLAGRYISQNPDSDPEVIAWHVNAFSHVDWGKLALEWMDAVQAKNRGDLELMQDFYRKRWVQPWDVRGVLKPTDTREGFGGYAKADKWDKEFIRILTVDVQKDHYWYVVRAWAKDGSSRLLAEGRALTALNLRELQTDMEIPDHEGKWLDSACNVFIDGNYNPKQVARMAALYHWYVLRGTDCRPFRHNDGIVRPYGEIEYIDAFEGTADQGSDLYVGQYKFSNIEAMNRLATLRQIKEPERIWTYANDASPDYLKQIDSWVRIAKKRSRDDSTYFDWIQREVHDHLFDCEKMNVIVASMSGVVGAESME